MFSAWNRMHLLSAERPDYEPGVESTVAAVAAGPRRHGPRRSPSTTC